MRNRIALCIAAFLTGINLLFAQFVQQGGALVGSDYSGLASQGKSVALSADGNTAIVGGYTDVGTVGAAWVYTRNGSGWSQQGGKLVGSGASNPARQGVSAALSADGNTAIVGGYVDGSGTGAAWIFTRSAGVWSQQGPKLVGTGSVGSSFQGVSVALSGDGNTAIIGGEFDNSNAGAAWIFVRNGSTWSQQGSKLVGTGAVGAAIQGQSVALSMDGNTAAVGGTSDNSLVGAVWVYTRADTVWSQQGAKLVGSDYVGSSVQGSTLSFANDGNTLLVGGHYDAGNTGAAWIFTRSGGVWTQEGNKLVGTGAIGAAMQGRWVALSSDGTTAVIGGPRDNNNRGANWVFTRSSGGWSQLGNKLTATGIPAESYLGEAVAISGDGKTIISGAPGNGNIVGGAFVFAQDSLRTVAHWSLNENSGSFVFDSSGWGNHGTANGTTIITGISGNARHFDGAGDYVYVPNPSNKSLDFDSSESFTISAWFRTTTTGYPEIVRKGLAPVPGYDLRMANGRLLGEIGTRWDGLPPDTVLQIFSDGLVNDGNWHSGSLVRDRSLKKLFLYVDNVAAAQPIHDHFPIPLRNFAPLEIGRWGVTPGSEDFEGDIDEVKIVKRAQHPPGAFYARIHVSPPTVDFGPTLLGEHSSAQLWISNTGIRETLNVAGVYSTNPAFVPIQLSFSILPGASEALQLMYEPTAVHTDTGSVVISSNDPSQPQVSIPLSGRGFTPGMAPTITKITDIPNDQGRQVRVIWARSETDDSLASLPAREYGVWRRVDDIPPAIAKGKYPERQIFEFMGNKRFLLNGQLWDFINSIPAVHFSHYSYVSPTLFDATNDVTPWSVFEVSVHLSDGTFFFSVPDSGYSVDDLSPDAPTQMAVHKQSNVVVVGWAIPDNPDIQHYEVYRTTVPSYPPASMPLVGVSQSNSYNDTQADLGTIYYYRVRSVDAAGNQSGFSAEVGSGLTGIDAKDPLPVSYQLYQNYPNPFNPSSTIKYDVPKDAYVLMRVYDILGREIATLVDGRKEQGAYFVEWDARNAPSGMYFVRMTSGSFVSVRKMLLLR